MTDDDPDRTIEDPNESAQDTRIRQLIQRRRDVIDAKVTATQLQVTGGAGVDQANQLFLNELQALIIDLWPLLRSEFRGAYLGSRYVDNSEDVELKHVGTFAVDPPDSLPTDRNDDRLAPGASPAAPKRIDVDGLAWFVEVDVPIPLQWDVRTMTRSNDATPGIVEVAPPTWVLIRGLNLCSEFMAEIGIDLDVMAEEYTGEGEGL